MDKTVRIAESPSGENARREFLAQCGRFAIVTPPAMTLLLSVAAKPKEAHASSILGNGWGGNKNKDNKSNNKNNYKYNYKNNR